MTAETRRVGDNKVLLEGVLWVRYTRASYKTGSRACVFCQDPVRGGDEAYRPAIQPGPGGGFFLRLVGRRARVCIPCVGRKLAEARLAG